jgi:hypothetical protein
VSWSEVVEFEGVRDMVCFKENKIPCMKLDYITCINTNPSAKKAAIELETRTNTSEGNLRMKATKIPIGTSTQWVGLSSPDLAYTTTLCLALVVFARRWTSRFRFAYASPCSRCENGGHLRGMRPGRSWQLRGVRDKLGGRWCRWDEDAEGP